jgi:hypothetical protein
MSTVVFDTFVENDMIKIPPQFRNKRVKIIIVDPEEKSQKKTTIAKKLNFKIDETLEDLVPFTDIDDSEQFAKELREKHWR